MRNKVLCSLLLIIPYAHKYVCLHMTCTLFTDSFLKINNYSIHPSISVHLSLAGLLSKVVQTNYVVPPGGSWGIPKLDEIYNPSSMSWVHPRKSLTDSWNHLSSLNSKLPLDVWELSPYLEGWVVIQRELILVDCIRGFIWSDRKSTGKLRDSKSLLTTMVRYNSCITADLTLHFTPRYLNSLTWGEIHCFPAENHGPRLAGIGSHHLLSAQKMHIFPKQPASNGHWLVPSKTYFSHLKKAHLKKIDISLSVHYI